MDRSNRATISCGQEQMCCTQCKQTAPTEDTATDFPTSRTKVVRVYCEHCGVTTVANYMNGGGAWSLVGRVERLQGNHLEQPKRKSA